MIRNALPSPRLACFGALAWAAAMGVSVLFSLWREAWETTAQVGQVALVYALGGAAAFPIGHVAARLLAIRPQRSAAFAAAFLGFAVATVGVTVLLFALQYRHYYATWHGDALTVEWFFQLAFTMANAAYQFAVLGLRLYLPLGLVALILLSLWYSSRAR